MASLHSIVFCEPTYSQACSIKWLLDTADKALAPLSPRWVVLVAFIITGRMPLHVEGSPEETSTVYHVASLFSVKHALQVSNQVTFSCFICPFRDP